MVIAMVMLPWPMVDLKAWMADVDEWLMEWPWRTGRVCPTCGAKALVGHGMRRRTVHAGRARAGGARPRCAVEWILVQRVRCKACGRTHTLLPAFVAPHQIHLSATRGVAVAERERGASWTGVLARLGLPTLSTTSVRRWVAAVQAQLPVVADAVVRWRAMLPGMAGYAPMQPPGSYAAFAVAVDELQQRELGGWPTGEALAGANWQASRRSSPLRI